MPFRRRRTIRRRRSGPRRVRRVGRSRRGARRGLIKNINKPVIMTDTVKITIPANTMGQLATNGLEAYFLQAGTTPSIKSTYSARMQALMPLYQEFKIVAITVRLVQRADTFIAAGSNTSQFASKPYIYRKSFKEFPLTMWKDPTQVNNVDWFQQQGCVGRPWGTMALNMRFKPFMYTQSLIYDVNPAVSTFPQAGGMPIIPNIIGSTIGMSFPTPSGIIPTGLVPQQVRYAPTLKTNFFQSTYVSSSSGNNTYQGGVSNPLAAQSQANSGLPLNPNNCKAPVQYGPYFFIQQANTPGNIQDPAPYTAEVRITLKFSKPRIQWTNAQANWYSGQTPPSNEMPTVDADAEVLEDEEDV